MSWWCCGTTSVSYGRGSEFESFFATEFSESYFGKTPFSLRVSVILETKVKAMVAIVVQWDLCNSMRKLGEIIRAFYGNY